MILKNLIISHSLFSVSAIMTFDQIIISVKENPPAKDGLSADDCERIIISLILENIIQPSPVWNAYE